MSHHCPRGTSYPGSGWMAAQHPSERAPWPVLAHTRRPGKKQEAKTCTFSFDLGSILSSLRPPNRHLIVTFVEAMWNPGQVKAECPHPITNVGCPSLGNKDPCQLQRRATIGSMREARRAGRYPATNATATSSRIMPANVSGSVGLVPNSSDVISAATAND